MDEETARRIRRSFASQTMMATLGAEVTEIAPGRVCVRAPISPGALQQQGFGHAGLTFAIGDSCLLYTSDAADE